MLSPKKTNLKDYHKCFYGHEFKKNSRGQKLYKKVKQFLAKQNMEITPFVDAGKWLWEELIKQMDRSAFCVFETKSQNRNVHIELGYALAKQLNVILLIRETKKGSYQKHLPSNLSGLVQIRYKNIDELPSKLEKELPKRYYSVEERLSANLQNVSEAEKIYFRIILEKSTISFSELPSQVRTKAKVLADNISISDFIRKYDEALEIDEKDHWDRCIISIDKKYEKWICKKLGISKKPNNNSLQRIKS